MKKLLVILVIVVCVFGLIAADAPPKPPREVNLDIVNRSGEDVIVSLVGLGYDFKGREFVGHWGVVYPGFHYVTVPGTIKTMMPSGVTVVTRLPEYVKNLHVLKDLYIISVTYEREIDGYVVCLNNWTPVKYYGMATYYPASGPHNKLIIKKCDSVPANLGAPGEGVIKYNRLRILLATSGYVR